MEKITRKKPDRGQHEIPLAILIVRIMNRCIGFLAFYLKSRRDSTNRWIEGSTVPVKDSNQRRRSGSRAPRVSPLRWYFNRGTDLREDIAGRARAARVRVSSIRSYGEPWFEAVLPALRTCLPQLFPP